MANSLNFSAKTAIVTGATGGLGRNLTQTLLAEGWQVLACGRNQSIGAQLATDFAGFDLADPVKTIQHFRQADVVFHCAALSSPWGDSKDFYQANVQATANVLAAIRHYGIAKLVHVSTPSIYFNFTDQRQIDEGFLPKRFVNAYAQSKFLAEQVIHRATDIDSVILRPRGIFGAYDTAILPRLLSVADKGYLPLVWRYGRQAGDAVIDLTYVDNVIDAMLLAYHRDIPRATAINITNDCSYPIHTLYQKLVETFNLTVKFKVVPYQVLDNIAWAMEGYARASSGQEPLLTRYSVGTIAFDQTLSLQRAKQLLGYQPKVSIETGLQRYADWLRHHQSA